VVVVVWLSVAAEDWMAGLQYWKGKGRGSVGMLVPDMIWAREIQIHPLIL
jgi:hypothetical protein